METRSNKARLEAMASSETSNWEKEALKRQADQAWRSKSEAIALVVLRALRFLGISQKVLAERVGVSPQYINKLVKGAENLSLETISRIEVALGIDLITVDLEASEHAKMQEYVPYMAIHYSRGYSEPDCIEAHSAKFTKDLSRVSA